MLRFLYLLLSISLLSLTACDPQGSGLEDDEPMLPTYDRKEMLAGWVTEVILPAYESTNAANARLATAAVDFNASPTLAQLNVLKADYRAAYLSWQGLSPFLQGLAEEVNLRLRVNTYPTNTELIEENIFGANVNLELPSQAPAQGFPALDYLLFGGDEARLIAPGPEASARREYLATLAITLRDLVQRASQEWTPAFQATYINNDGNSATASVDRTVNDYIFHYERFLRAGKVGIPAGVFSDDPLADRAESLYEGNGKALLLASLAASRDFFENHGLADYLDALDVMRDGELLSTKINDQFAAIEAETANVGDDFAAQVTTDNSKMLNLYDEMQRLVVLLKVDMLQALSINVDYVDADGD